MEDINFFFRDDLPIERYKTKVVQNVELIDTDCRLNALEKAGFNPYLLRSEDVFLDFLTDSGNNALSDLQLSHIMESDDAYAGAKSYIRLEKVATELFDMKYFLPVHQGRAAEHIIAEKYVIKDSVIPANCHFTTTKSMISHYGGEIIPLICDEGLNIDSNYPFKGNINLEALIETIKSYGKKIPFVRIELGANLMGGQPVSIKNIKDASRICRKYNIKLVIDASLMPDNVYFIKTREIEWANSTPEQIIQEIAHCCDILYFSGRKLIHGGGILCSTSEIYHELRDLVLLYEGYITYGGMSSMDMEGLAQALEEIKDFSRIRQGPELVEYMTNRLIKEGIPMVVPSGGLGAHVDASGFLPTVPQNQYPGASLSAALYLISGIRTLERGTLSAGRSSTGEDNKSPYELLRIAPPRRAYSVSHIEYTVDRLKWLYDNRGLIKGMEWEYEPPRMRVLTGKLKCIDLWHIRLIHKFKTDYSNLKNRY